MRKKKKYVVGYDGDIHSVCGEGGHFCGEKIRPAEIRLAHNILEEHTLKGAVIYKLVVVAKGKKEK